ncbi:MAG: sulfite exporter TauE/SafE family protein [Chitinophagaceae bacterium]|jgi:hypothetical protein
MEILGYAASVLIGISIGLIGAGGSILAVPILVYLFSVNPQLATSYSLLIVGITSFLGAIRHYTLGNLHFRTAILFAIPSVGTLLLVRHYILPVIPEHIISLGNYDLTKDTFLMVVFAVLMLAASFSMIKRPAGQSVGSVDPDVFRIVLLGIGVGVVTGFLGAGGGFLIIPALIFFAGLPMKQAVGTSLLIIFLNSIIGFSGDLIKGVQLDFQLLISVTLIAIIGMFIGTQLSKKIAGEKLRPAFGWFVLIMGIYIIFRELFYK